MASNGAQQTADGAPAAQAKAKLRKALGRADLVLFTELRSGRAGIGVGADPIAPGPPGP